MTFLHFLHSKLSQHQIKKNQLNHYFATPILNILSNSDIKRSIRISAKALADGPLKTTDVNESYPEA